MLPVNVHALRRKETITEKSVPLKWCVFSMRSDPCVGKTLSFESSDVALFYVPPKYRFPASPPHDTYTVTAAAEHIAIKAMHILRPMSQWRKRLTHAPRFLSPQQVG